MALTVLTFPENKFTNRKFDLRQVVVQNKLRSGKTQSMEVGLARWVAEYTTKPYNYLEVRKWLAFWNRLRGGNRGFLAHDPLRVYPSNYPNGFTGLVRAGGSTPFDGTADLVTITDAYTLALATLPANFVLKAGDLMELKQGTSYSLHEIAVDVTAGSGGTASVSIEPAVSTTVFNNTAVPNFLRPSCVMIPDPDSWSFDPTPGEPAPVTFGGVQAIY